MPHRMVHLLELIIVTKMLKSIKENLVPGIMFFGGIGLLIFPIWSHFHQEKEISVLRVSGNEQLVGASTLFAQNASVQLNFESFGTYASTSGNFAFGGEIMPDGATCANDQILKRAGANNWDCAADADTGTSGLASASYSEVRENSSILTTFRDISVASFSFNDGAFDLTASGTQDVVIKLDWVNGPASLSEADTITGNWVNTANPWADNEVIDALTVTGGVIGANSISGTQTTTGTLTIGDNGDSIIIDASNWDVSTLGKADFLSASVSTNFEAIGYASASSYLGAAFNSVGDCNDTTEAIAWTTTGIFSCRAVQDLDATLTALAAFNTNGLLTQTAADTFAGRTLTGTTNQITVANGDGVSGNPTISIPTLLVVTNASASFGEFTNYASAQFYLGTAFSTVGDCNDGAEALRWTTTGVFSCGTFTGGTGVDITTDDFTFDSTEIEATTWGAGGNATNIWTHNLSAGDPTLTWTTSGASFSLNFEVIGYASASSYFGTAFYTSGTQIDCNDAAEGLQWSAGVFTCRAWVDADIPDAITVSGGTIGSNNISSGVTWTTLGTLTIGDNGDNIVFDSNTWDISGAGVGSGFTGFTSTGVIDLGGATSFEIPNAAAPTVDATGEIALHTGSSSIDWFDGTNTIVERNKKCFTYVVDSPTAANPGKVGPIRFDDPFTLVSVQPVASGTNSAGWNLRYGAPGSITTSVFTNDKSASTSSYPTYTSFANSTVLNGDALELIITSRSAVLQTFSTSICGRFNH